MFFESHEERAERISKQEKEETDKIKRIVFGLLSPLNHKISHHLNNVTDVLCCAKCCGYDLKAKLGIDPSIISPDSEGRISDESRKLIWNTVIEYKYDYSGKTVCLESGMYPSGYECFLQSISGDERLTLKALEIYGELVFSYFKMGICLTINNFLIQRAWGFLEGREPPRSYKDVLDNLYKKRLDETADAADVTLHTFWNPLNRDDLTHDIQKFYVRFSESAARLIDDGWRGHFDPRLLYRLAKFKDQGCKGIITKNEREANFFYCLFYLILTGAYFNNDQFIAGATISPRSSTFLVGDLSPLDDETYLDMFLNTYHDSEKEENEVFDHLMSNAISYERNHGFDWSPKLEYICEKVGEESMTLIIAGLKEEVFGCLGSIVLQRNEYEKADCYFANVSVLSENYPPPEFADHSDTEEKQFLFGELLPAEMDGSILCDRVGLSIFSHCALAEISAMERTDYPPSSDEYEIAINQALNRLTDLELNYLHPRGIHGWHPPIEADLLFPTADITYENIRASRDIYIECQRRTSRGRHYSFEYIGQSILNQPTAAYKNIAKICEIIKERKEREPNDEIFLQLFDKKQNDQAHREAKKDD